MLWGCVLPGDELQEGESFAPPDLGCCEPGSPANTNCDTCQKESAAGEAALSLSLQFLFGRFEPLCVRAERSSAGHLICRWHLTADSEGCLLPSACRESETPPVCLLLMRGLVPLPRLPLPPFRSPSSAPPAWLGLRSLLAPWGWADGWCCWDRKGWTRCLLDGWISNLSVHPFLSSLCVAALQV